MGTSSASMSGRKIGISKHLIPALVGLLAGGVAWLITSVVDGSSTRALLEQTVQQSAQALKDHSKEARGTEKRVSDIEAAINQLAANQGNLTELLKETRQDHKKDVKELEKDIKQLYRRPSRRSSTND